MSCGIIEALLPCIDSLLGIRDDIGGVIQPVYFVTRTWYTDGTFVTQSTEQGSGVAKDVEVQMLPSPGLKNFAQDIRLKEGGTVKSGDIILKGVSKNLYTEANLDGSSSALNIEKLFRVGGKIYQVINVMESYVTWDVQIRELTNQARYL